LTAVELGRRVGLSKQAMREIESGRNGTTIERAASFAKELDVSLDYLVGLSDNLQRR
jgi:transcriptional regulator with XRE-family HTH domain